MAQKYFGLQWHITDSCDQRCKHCYIYAGKDLCKNNDLPFEKLSVILQDFIITCKKLVEILYFIKMYGIFSSYSSQSPKDICNPMQ